MAEIIGKIKIIGELQEFSNNFTKKQLVVSTDEQYSTDVPIDFIKDKISLLDNFDVDDQVKVSVNIKGSEYQGKYYVSLNAWRIEKMESQTPQPHHADHPTNMPSGNQAPPQPYMPSTDFKEEEHDDLPF